MSGDYQHFIPQLILKGFSTKAPDGSKCVWVFQPGTSPTLKPIKRMGGDTHFYSTPTENSSETLDDAITKYENRLAGFVRSLRKQKPGFVKDVEVPAEVIAHLTIRTNNVRTSFSRATKQMIAKASVAFANEEYISGLLGLSSDSPSEHFREMLTKVANENPAFHHSGLSSGAIERVLFGYLRENFTQFFKESRPQMHAALAAVYARTDDTISNGHKKLLSESIVPENRVEVLKKMQWEIVEAGENLILPDCISVGMDADGNATPLLLTDTDKILMVAMPIGARRLVVGKTDPRAEFKPFLFNLHAAACSETFFVSAANTTELEEWSKYISVRSQTVINRGLQDIFAKHIAGNRSTETAPNPTGDLSPPLRDAAADMCSVHFYDCADEPTAKEIANTVWEVIRGLQGFMPLHRLDGITFANDYSRALGNLDRGFAYQRPLETTSEEGVEGVAMAPLVLRDGVVKSHLVLRGYLGHALLSEAESYHAIAFHTLVSELAEAASVELFDTALPGVLLHPQTNYFDAQRLSYVESAWRAYYSASFASPFAPEIGPFLREVTAAALERACAKIPQLRLDYRFHGEIPKLLDGSLGLISAVLEHSARLIGHYEGLSQSPFDDESDLDATLKKFGLRPWFEAYQTDLRKLWERRGQWKSLDEFLSLGIHVERLMWQSGIVLWQTSDGSCRVEVPLATDLGRLRAATLKRPLWFAKAVAKNILLKIKRAA